MIGITLGVVIGYFAFKIDEESYVLKSDLKDFGIRYNLSTAFLRDLFPDEIVYLDNGQVTFTPIDPDLSLHEYDWHNLVNVDGRLDYRLDGQSIVITGIDVSKFQATIDWSKVKEENINFAMLRVGYRAILKERSSLIVSFMNMRLVLFKMTLILVYIFSHKRSMKQKL